MGEVVLWAALNTLLFALVMIAEDLNSSSSEDSRRGKSAWVRMYTRGLHYNSLILALVRISEGLVSSSSEDSW